MADTMAEARAKMIARRFGGKAGAKTGGKGSVRRKKKTVHKTATSDDKKIGATLKKLGCSDIPGIEEVNIFNKNGTVVHFKHGVKLTASTGANTYVVTGKGEEKQLQDLMPGIMPHLGPDLMRQMQAGGMGGGGGRARQRTGPMQGDDLRADLELDFKTACFGGQEKVRITHLESCATCTGSGIKPGAKVTNCATCNGAGVVMQVTRTPLGSFQTQTVCPECRGTGQSVDAYCPQCSGQGVERKAKQVSVTIPCGVDTGNKLRVAGEGDAGPRGGPAGDLYIFLSVRGDQRLSRDGVDITSQLDVDAVDAILGATTTTTTLDDDAKEISVPAGTQPGTRLRLKGQGAPALGKATSRGDHYVTVNVKVPTDLSDDARKLVEELREKTRK
mmetsp:Transcript_35233/g.109233  ORF Transcript_35233/g.109233 Transcript_35233/m.109233 type:complete len:388 (+) Transcript_35233:124-1287(+)